MNGLDKKHLAKVILNADVYAVCLQHALSTEKEEVMGLLIGHVDEENCVSHISSCTILRRADKQPDRVEISSEQLMQATEYAENLSKRLNMPLRVIGWYHSHPHITVWPSHVDLQTQGSYQMLDQYFVGLIFAVYPKNAGSSDNQIQMTAFQAMDNGDRLEINIEIKNSPVKLHNLEALASISKILVQEEIENHIDIDKNDSGDLLNRLHNDSFKTLKHLHIITKVTLPVCESLEERLKVTKLRIKELEGAKEVLLKAHLG